MGEATYNVGQRLVTRLWYTVQDPFSTARQSSFQNSFHTLSPCFFSGPSLSITDQDCKETSWVKLTPHCGSAVRHPSLIHKSGSIQHSKTVQFPKLFSHSSCFL